MRASSRPIAVDLFAGVGGFSLGIEQAGFDVVTAIEYDPVHAGTYTFNFPQTEVLCRNVAMTSVEELVAAIRRGAHRHGRRWRGKVDLLFGGPPCQGFSVGGTRREHDERNRLVFEFVRMAEALDPSYIIIENVPPMRTVEIGAGLPLITQLYFDLDDLGYDVTAEKIVNAKNLGVPQDRRRLVIVATRRGENPCHLPQTTVNPVTKRPSTSSIVTVEDEGTDLPSGPTVRDAIGDLPNVDFYPELWHSDAAHAACRRLSDYAARLRGEQPDGEDCAYPRHWDADLVTSSMRTAHSPKAIARFAATAPGATEAVSRFYRLHPDGLSGTLRAGTGYERGSFSAPRPIHPWFPRVITVREAARLHSFPDWFRLHVTKWHGFRQVGNSLPVLAAREIGAQVMNALNRKATRPDRVLDLGDDALLWMNVTEAAEHFGVPLDGAPNHTLRRRKGKLADGADATSAAAEGEARA